MKRTGFKSRGKPLSAKKPMNKVSAKRKAYRASEEGKAGITHMLAVKQLPCCICGVEGQSEAHHCRSGGMMRDDLKTIPLCPECHRGPSGYHMAKRTWEAANGPDHGYIEQTLERLK